MGPEGMPFERMAPHDEIAEDVQRRQAVLESENANNKEFQERVNGIIELIPEHRRKAAIEVFEATMHALLAGQGDPNAIAQFEMVAERALGGADRGAIDLARKDAEDLEARASGRLNRKF